MHLYQVLKRPIISEKTTALKEQGKYAFEVTKGASRRQVKEAVELAFKVNVVKVNIINMPGKTRRFGRRQVLTSEWKKAVVTLAPGQKIEFFEGV